MRDNDGPAADFRRAGEALYGHLWQAPIARALHVNPRRVRAWAAQEADIPSGVWSNIYDLLQAKIDDLDTMQSSLATTYIPF